MNPTSWIGRLDSSKRYTVSNTPITGVRNTAGELETRMKPAGLWYACGPEWIDWLESEMPDWLENVRFVYEVVPNFKEILELNSVQDIRDFDAKYGVGSPYARRGSSYEVRWQDVAEGVDGIEICPYQWSLRDSEVGWYATWDVASGCIWRPGGVKELRLVAKR
jgi:hypothetical protein